MRLTLTVLSIYYILQHFTEVTKLLNYFYSILKINLRYKIVIKINMKWFSIKHIIHQGKKTLCYYIFLFYCLY